MKRLSAILLLSVLVLCSCKSQRMKELEGLVDYYNKQIIRLKHSLEQDESKEPKLRERLAEAKEKAEPSLALEAEVEKATLRRHEIGATIPALETEIREKVALLRAYKDAFQPKLIPLETELGDITLSDGRTLSDVVIKEVNPTDMRIRHSGGFTSIPFAEIPEEIRSNFVLTPPPAESRIDPEMVLSRRPSSLMSEDERQRSRTLASKRAMEQQQQRAREMEAQRVAREQEMDRRRAESERQRELDAKKREAEQRARDEYLQKVDGLLAEIDTLNDAISEQESRKRDAEYRMQNSTIAVSAQDQRKTLKAYEDKINALKQKVAELRQKVAQVPRP